MLFYYGKQFESANVGGRLVRVECDHCQCVYHYQLARVGEGAANSHFGIGNTAAAESAEDRARQNLKQRLVDEAELVPCPKCNWINEELVEGYRQSQYRGAGGCALAIGLVGTVSSLICAWCAFAGPIPEEKALPYFLFVGPAIFISIAVAILFYRRLARSLIRPNRNFPLPPKLPEGTPPALIDNIETGELQPFPTKIDPIKTSNDWIDFQIWRSEFPPICCVCLKKDSPDHAYKLDFYKEIKVSVPRCADCHRAARQKYLRIFAKAFLIALLVSCTPLFLIKLDPVWFWFLIVSLPLISYGLACAIAGTCTEPASLSFKDVSRGTTRIHFGNPDYCAIFVQHQRN